MGVKDVLTNSIQEGPEGYMYIFESEATQGCEHTNIRTCNITGKLTGKHKTYEDISRTYNNMEIT